MLADLLQDILNKIARHSEEYKAMRAENVSLIEEVDKAIGLAERIKEAVDEL